MKKDILFHIRAGYLMLKRRILNHRFRKDHKLDKSVNEILKESINKNFESFFSPGLGHFEDFYIRDFAWVIDSLINLNYKEEVDKTLSFVLKSYYENDRITTSITKNNSVYDFPTYAIDSLPYLIYCINKSDYNLNKKEKLFLKSKINEFYNHIDKGFVDKNKFFSSMADHKVRNSSLYSNTMHYLLSVEIQKLGLKPKFFPKQISKNVIKEFWNGSYYYDDLSKKSYISADAQIFPFWTGLDSNPSRLKKVIELMKKEKLDNPIPLRYHKKELFENYSIFNHIINMFKKTNIPKYHAESIFCYRYETDPIWTLLGINYFHVLNKFHQKTNQTFFLDELKNGLKKYNNIILKYGTLYELYENKKPFKSLLYFSEEDIIWGAKILDLNKKYKL